MNLTDLLTQAGGLQSIARDLGLSQQQTAAGADALLPAILGGMKKQAQAQPSGLEDLSGLLGQLGGGGLFDRVLDAQPTNPAQGNDVLGQIFGSKDVSRAVADNAASQSGLDTGVLKKMLPLLAMLVTGYLAKQAGGAQQQTSTGEGSSGLGGLVGSLGGMFGGGGAGAGALGGSSAMGGLGGLLDLNRDGNALDDILRMVSKGRG